MRGRWREDWAGRLGGKIGREDEVIKEGGEKIEREDGGKISWRSIIHIGGKGSIRIGSLRTS
jgi:hypothetical protein